MDLRDALRSTGAVREFRSDPVPDEVVGRILDTARFAPSGGNRQGWRVALVKDHATRRQLASLMHEVWDEYVSSAPVEGSAPLNTVDPPSTPTVAHHPNPLLENIESVPAVLVVAADLRLIAMMDKDLDRPPLTGGASIYPFCWNLLLAARAHGLGGVITTFLARAEPAAAPLLGLPEHHAIAAVLFLGRPVHQPTRLTRRPVSSFATIDRFDGPALA